MFKTSFGFRFLALICVATLLSCGGNGGEFPGGPQPPIPTLRSTADAHGIKVGAAADSGFLNETKYSSILGSEFS